MASEENVRDVKERLKYALFAIEGVTGIGVGNERLRIYIKTDSVKTRIGVMNLLKRERAGVDVEFIASGQAFLQKNEPRYEGMTVAEFWNREKECLEKASPKNIKKDSDSCTHGHKHDDEEHSRLDSHDDEE